MTRHTPAAGHPHGDPVAPTGDSTITITVNGAPRRAHVEPHTSTLDWLRSLGLTGAKEGCAEGECGACSVLVVRPDLNDATSRLTALNSCLVPAAALDGQEVVTSEGLGTPHALHPVQHEMATRGGSQCGYCTPGFVCSMAAEFYRHDRAVDATSSDVPHSTDAPPTTDSDPADAENAGDHLVGENGFDLHALSGNLCRCTGYRPIRDAAFALCAPDADDPLNQRRSAPAPPHPATLLRAQGRSFHRPATLAQALDLLAEHPQALLLAGSTDWGVELTIKRRRATTTIAIDHLPELRALSIPDDLTREGVVELGAALSLSDLERATRGRIPVLDQLWPQFASRLIRNGATLGGNIGTASPIGDAPPCLLSLDASLVLASRRGERTVPLADYFTGYRETVKAADEVIRSVLIPTPLAATGWFSKIAKRRFDDISGVAIAISADLAHDHAGIATIERIAIGLGGVAATPIRARSTEAALVGRAVTAATIAEAAAILAGEDTPMDDHRASAAYRRAMLGQALPHWRADLQRGQVAGGAA